MARNKATSKRSQEKGEERSPAEISPGVFVGGWDDAEHFSGARFCVLDTAPPKMPPATHIRIFDHVHRRADRAALDRLAQEVEAARRQGSPTLIFCGHGAMRSPLGAMWYLHRTKGASLDEAFEQVRARRSRAVHPREWVKNVSELNES